MSKASKWDNILNNIIETGYFIVPLLMKVAFFVLALLGLIMSVGWFYQVNPDLLGQPPTWDSAWLQASSMASWPFTAAPLWWKASFFPIVFLLLLPYLFTNRDP